MARANLYTSHYGSETQSLLQSVFGIHVRKSLSKSTPRYYRLNEAGKGYYRRLGAVGDPNL